MHIALTGASGFIGSNIARRLHDAGHTVAALVRSSSRRDHVEPYVDRFIVGAQDDRTVWGDLLDHADCVIHNAFDWRPLRAGDATGHWQSNLLAALQLLEAAADRQFIYMSSVAVHHDMRPRWQGRIDEDHPSRPAGLYGACKTAVEAHLWSAHFSRGQSTCALRPCAVYGIDPDLQRSIGYPIIRQIMHGKPFTKPGGGKFVHVDDVAAATVAAVGNPDAAGSVCNLADCYARWADLALMTRDLLGADVQIDLSSPPQSKNQFTKDAANSLNVRLDRGHDGLRTHLRQLIETMQAA